jgi:hypothetical protein
VLDRFGAEAALEQLGMRDDAMLPLDQLPDES